MPPRPAQEREPSRRRPWHQGPGDVDCRWNLFSMYCRPVGQVIFANWLATTSAMSGKSPIHSSRRLVPGSRLVWSGSGLKSTWMENALLVEVPEQLACPRFNCNTNHRASCSPGWRTAAGKTAFAELPNGIDDRRLANPTPCEIRKNKDQLFRSHNAESRTEHPAFAKQSSLVDETGIEPATSSLRTV